MHSQPSTSLPEIYMPQFMQQSGILLLLLPFYIFSRSPDEMP